MGQLPKNITVDIVVTDRTFLGRSCHTLHLLDGLGRPLSSKAEAPHHGMVLILLIFFGKLVESFGLPGGFVFEQKFEGIFFPGLDAAHIIEFEVRVMSRNGGKSFMIDSLL